MNRPSCVCNGRTKRLAQKFGQKNLLRQAADELLPPETKRRKRKQNGASTTMMKKIFLAEIYLMLGKIIEWKEPNVALAEYMNAHRLCPKSPATNYNVARLVWKQASTSHDMKKAEEYLRATIKYAEEDGDEEAEYLWDNGMELLALAMPKWKQPLGGGTCNTQGPTIQICFSVTLN